MRKQDTTPTLKSDADHYKDAIQSALAASSSHGIIINFICVLISGVAVWGIMYLSGIKNAVTNLEDIKARVTTIENSLGPLEKITAKVEDIPQSLATLQSQQNNAIAAIGELKNQGDQIKRLADSSEKLKESQDGIAKQVASLESQIQKLEIGVQDTGRAVALIKNPTQKHTGAFHQIKIQLTQTSVNGKAVVFSGKLSEPISTTVSIQPIILTPELKDYESITTSITNDGYMIQVRILAEGKVADVYSAVLQFSE